MNQKFSSREALLADCPNCRQPSLILLKSASGRKREDLLACKRVLDLQSCKSHQQQNQKFVFHPAKQSSKEPLGLRLRGSEKELPASLLEMYRMQFLSCMTSAMI